ncbi:GntR family transcriptional regulator [Streptomyces sp. MMS24-I29]|uniref:GntR family transcriptional regulator n=1 Tax=Streptomyces sp. MMS24-I29 TaxID=3351480 RepID=UPI003C7B210C
MTDATEASDAADRLELSPTLVGESSAAYATRIIREGILTGVLAPGSKIPQESIATRLDMSRIPIRDALRQLESEGLVVIPSNRSAKVARLDAADFAEIYDMRELIEPYVVGMTARSVTARQLGRLEALADQFDKCVESNGDVLSVDREFHLLTMSGAPRKRVWKLVTELQNASQQYRRAFHDLDRSPCTQAKVCKEHHDLVDALRARDEVAAVAITRRHLARTRALLEPVLLEREVTR